MKTIHFSIVKLLLSSLFIFLLACEDGTQVVDPPTPEPSFETFMEVIDMGDDIENFPITRTTDTLSNSVPQKEDKTTVKEGNQVEERFICTSRTLSVLDGNGEFPLFNTNADVIYPGSLIQYKSLNNATPSPIVVKRAAGVISYDLNNGNLKSTFRVDSVQKGAIQEGMNTIINSAGPVVPANFNLEIHEVQSQKQLALEVGMKVETWTTQVGANMAFSTDKQYNRFLVKLTQSYYTMSFDLPTSLAEIFHPSVTPEQLSKFVQADNPATFISSVTYGRIFYMLVESTSSSTDMRSKLDISYGKFNNSVEGEVEVNAFNSMQDVKLKVIAYGGDAKGTFEIAGQTSIEQVAAKLAESTDIRAGLPLSYVLRSVERPDQIVGTKIATEYDVTNCELKGILPPVGYRSLLDLFDDGYGAMIHINNSNVVFYNKAGTQYAWYNGNSGEVLGTFSINDPNGPLGASSFESIGAGVRYSDNTIYLFNETGLQNEIFEYDPAKGGGNGLPSSPLGTFRQSNGANRIYLVNDIFGDSGNFQFAGRGFQAVTRIGAVKMKYFGNPGEEYAVYDRSGSGSWDSPKSNSAWAPASKGGKLFEQVGAATWIFFGGNSGRWLYINEKGDQLLEWYSIPIGQEKYEGPWVIN